ncbi:hypothetical protein Gogos_000173 [Gossypium gossypioides]|uniref:Pectate lyase superfamily protein domain-containing protein n=1 Tax=Gossypium gossypioides TaxID=34282 RepID=A0A7J9CSG3_GOSGO|nr:hypothetical protein [Gossypium gossypioides]
MLAINSTSATTKYNVFNFVAKPNGKTDSSTKAFLMAWEATCSSADSTMISIPKGRYLLGSMAFQGANGVSILVVPLMPKDHLYGLAKLPTATVLRSHDVQGVRIIAAGNSPNTDDCISIGPSTKNL